jgi:L-ascorbate metabolism protein UlaG (beta-lactamase superfamily)
MGCFCKGLFVNRLIPEGLIFRIKETIHMQITWYGHSCFLLTAESGYSILTDPCDSETGYDLHDIVCDAVTVSHDHHDHNCLASVKGAPLVIRTPGAHLAGEISVTGFSSFHDDAKGARRGENIVFLFQIDGLHILHLGIWGICSPTKPSNKSAA